LGSEAYDLPGCNKDYAHYNYNVYDRHQESHMPEIVLNYLLLGYRVNTLFQPTLSVHIVNPDGYVVNAYGAEGLYAHFGAQICLNFSREDM